MIAAMSSTCLVLGGSLAYAALRRPSCQAILERCGGALMVTGLALLGTGLGIHP